MPIAYLTGACRGRVPQLSLVLNESLGQRLMLDFPFDTLAVVKRPIREQGELK